MARLVFVPNRADGHLWSRSRVGHLALRTSGLRETLPPILTVPLPALVAGALLPYLAIRLLYRSTLANFGVYWRDRQRPFVGWLLGSSAVVLCGWFLFWLLMAVLLEFGARQGAANVPALSEFHAQNPLHMLLHGERSARLIAHLLHMFVFVGFAEELFGRGLLQNALDRRYSTVFGRGRFTIRASTLLAAVLFAFWHTQWLSFDPLRIAGSAATSLTVVLIPSLILAIVYERTRSMLAVILLHNVIDGGKLVTWYLVSRILPG